MPTYRILLVDDEEEVLDAWATSLRPLKHFVVTAHNEEEAVSAAEKHPFDLVLVDYLIPPTTGVEVVAAIRKKIPLIRAILISGRFDDKVAPAELREMVRGRVEVDEYLHKPVQPKLLRETVTRLLTGGPIEWVDVADKTVKASKLSQADTDAVKEDLKKHLKERKN